MFDYKVRLLQVAKALQSYTILRNKLSAHTFKTSNQNTKSSIYSIWLDDL